MHRFALCLVVALAALFAGPVLAADAIHRTQLQVAECRFDLNHDGAFETTYQAQSSNRDCPCFSASAPARAASEPDWPVRGCSVAPTIEDDCHTSPEYPECCLLNPPDPAEPGAVSVRGSDPARLLDQARLSGVLHREPAPPAEPCAVSGHQPVSVPGGAR